MKLIVLDRDGVINEDSDDYIKSADEWKPLAGSVEAIASLTEAGYTVVVATNQSGLARGLFDITDLHEIHKKMHQLVNQAGGRIDAIFFCSHGPADDCDCRKPKPGMLHSAMDHLNTDMAGVPVVGDSLRDLQAGMAVGAMPILVLTGKGAKTLESNAGLEGHVAIYEDLSTFVTQLLEKEADE